MDWRMLGPVVAATTIANGRSYSGAPGEAYDVIDSDAAILGANGWTKVCPSGPTSARPPTAQLGGYWAARGFKFFDTTINSLIVYDGAAWRDPVTGSFV
jgi:hypothetical protein